MKNKYQVSLKSIGLYEGFNKKSKNVPKLIKYCKEIPLSLGIEFGYVLNIKKAKGKRIDFIIDHPPFLDSQNKPAPPFKGEVYVTNNDFLYFLGDTTWEPLDNKAGEWRFISKIENKVIADETILIKKNY